MTTTQKPMAATTKPLTKTQEARYQRLISYQERRGLGFVAQPRWIRCYDNGGADREGGSWDRYTVVYSKRGKDGHPYLAMSSMPFVPCGFCQHGEGGHKPIDYPTYGHIGKKIAFHTLPEDCQRAVLQDYAAFWDLPLDRLILDCIRPTY